MKETKLTEKDFMEIKSISTVKWVSSSKKETALIEAVIDSFITYCNYKKYIIKDGKILINEEIKC